MPIVTAHADDIERHEIASAMLQADREVINKHARMFDEGIVRNADGKLEYNPAAYKAKQDRKNKLQSELAAGKITPEEYQSALNEAQELPAYNSEDVKNNPYKRRIQAIIDTRKDNEALNWMINDIENGDGVTKILEELAEQQYKEDTKSAADAKAKEESETLPFEESAVEPEVEIPSTTTNVAEPVKTPKQRYEERKARANKKYKERKKSIRDLRKKMFASLVPIPTPLMDIANALITKAEIATYKISQFAEELREIAKQKGYNANTFLSGIKSFYIDKLVSTLTTNPQLSENFSSNQEIVQFMFNDVVISQPVGSGLTNEIQEQINRDNEKIYKELTTHYDVFVKDGDNVTIYPNREAIINARFADNPGHANTIEVLTAANTSDESFRQALNGLFVSDNSAPIDLYVKYRNVDGIINAIANRRWTQEYEESVIAGKLMRNTVMAIMFGREDQIERGIVSDPAVYAEFRKQVKDAYLKLTSKTNGMGLTVIDCNKAIYGTDYNGERISSEADLIATDGNKLYAIDIRYSFQGLRDNWNVKYPKATFTVGDHVKYRLKQVEQIINSRFKRGVNGLYCLGVVYNPGDNILTIDIKNGSYFIPVKAETQDPHDDTVEGMRNSVESIVSEINKNIKEYNTYAEEARKFVDGYPEMPEITPDTFESVQQYNDYLN